MSILVKNVTLVTHSCKVTVL